MKKIYLDSDFKCHLASGGAMTALETEAFDGRSDAFIESCRFVPAEETWIREDGEAFRGEMMAPWKMPDGQGDLVPSELERLRAENADMAEALALLGYEEGGNG